MKHKPIQDTKFFFATAPVPCPYLPGRMERRVVTELVGRDAVALHDALSLAGFRRSHAIVYAPACIGCEACVPVRIDVARFRPSRIHRRVWAKNADLFVSECEAMATPEQFRLFAAYQRTRHEAGDMAKMDFADYQALIEDTPIDTAVVEFRDGGGRLVGACLTDRIAGGLSAVYSFFDPDLDARSLGTLMILWLVERAGELGLGYVYLGFWIDGCKKMSYKARFRPLEARTAEGWRPLEEIEARNRETVDGARSEGAQAEAGADAAGTRRKRTLRPKR